MKKIIGLVLLALISFPLFLIALMPVERALDYGRDHLQNVYVDKIGGTLWQGQARKLQVAGYSFSDVKWNFRPLALLTGSLAYQVSFDGDRFGSGSVGYSLLGGGISVSQFKASLPIEDLDKVLNLAPIKLTGLIALDLNHLDLEGKLVTSADGLVRWVGAGATRPAAFQLGDFSATLSDAENGVSAEVKSEGEAFDLNGTFLLQPDGTYNFTGKAGAGPQTPRSIAQGLSMFGAPDKDGKVEIVYDGQL